VPNYLEHHFNHKDKEVFPEEEVIRRNYRPSSMLPPGKMLLL